MLVVEAVAGFITELLALGVVLPLLVGGGLAVPHADDAARLAFVDVEAEAGDGLDKAGVLLVGDTTGEGIDLPLLVDVVGVAFPNMNLAVIVLVAGGIKAELGLILLGAAGDDLVGPV